MGDDKDKEVNKEEAEEATKTEGQQEDSTKEAIKEYVTVLDDDGNESEVDRAALVDDFPEPLKEEDLLDEGAYDPEDDEYE